jgi:4-alpha-glucanotransferase
VAGVPPDYFSPTGQLWGNPLYDWRRMAERGYAWWIERLRHTLDQVDLVRLDHFRGFAGYWEVPADAEVATHGRWVEGPGRAFFDAVAEALGGLPFLAEDLGDISPDVIALRDDLGLPGMAVLHFAFSPEPRSTFIPYAHTRNLAVYTGTHDNNTTLGWFLDDASEGERELVRRYVGSDCREVHWDLTRLALASVADLAVVPHQDLAGLGSDCRMNTPAVADGNWTFRITDWMLSDDIRDRLAEMVDTYGRAPARPRG